MSNEPGKLSVRLSARPDPNTIRGWDHLVSHTPESDVARLGFRPSVAGIAPAASIKIDLTRDVADLRNGLTSGNRRRTRTGAGRGVVVRRGGEGDLPMVVDLLARTAAHQRFDPLSLDYLRTLYRELDRGDHVQIFIAELDGVGAVAELFTSCGGVLTSRLTGMHRDDRVKKSGAAAAVSWHTILWAKAHGYHALDFAGIPVNVVDMIGGGGTGRTVGLPGPEVFKASFGGQPSRYPSAVELLSSRLLRTGYDLSRRTEVGGRLVATVRRLMQGRGDK